MGTSPAGGPRTSLHRYCDRRCLSTKWNCQTVCNPTNCRRRRSMLLLLRQVGPPDLLPLRLSMGYPTCLYDPVSYPDRPTLITLYRKESEKDRKSTRLNSSHLGISY